MRKVFLLAILVVLASWYFHFGRQLSQAGVVAYYDEQMALASRFDAKGACAGLDEGYRGVDVAFSSAGTKRTELDKFAACRNAEEGFEEFRKLSDATRGLLYPVYDTDIRTITLSDDEKLATVQGTMTIKMGRTLLARTKFTERLIRRRGRIFSVGSESRTWAYVGE